MPFNPSIPGQVSEYQLKAIETVAALAPKNGHIVEIGSLFGSSSWAWAKSVDPSVTVHCFDPWEANAGVRSMEARYGVKYGLEQFQKYTADCPNIQAHKGFSPRDFKDWSQPVDLYYEDAVHTDPILAENLKFWSGHVGKGGILCGDDYRPRFPDVRNGAETLAKKFGRELITVDFFWCLLPAEDDLPGADAVAAKLRELSRQCDAEKRARGPLITFAPFQPIDAVRAGSSRRIKCRLENAGIDPWPAKADGPLTAVVRIRTANNDNQEVFESLRPLEVEQVGYDVPLDFEIALPTGSLPAGDYIAEFEVRAPGEKKSARTPGEKPYAARFQVAAHFPGERRPLMDREIARHDFASAAFADSHGAFDVQLGAGSLYYALGQLVRSQVSVCIGSGGGFVPSLMRRAQLDAGIDPAVTYLVDANLPDLAFGSPNQQGGWMTEESAFLKRESDIFILPMLSIDAARVLAGQGVRIDHLHIDGDHSARGVLADFESYAPLVSEMGVITLHDLRMPSLTEALEEIQRRYSNYELISFPEIGAGTGVMRKRLPRSTPRRVQSVSGFVDRKRKVRIPDTAVENAADDVQEKVKFERWAYLETGTYSLRYTLASRFVDEEGVSVVEVGGFPSSIASHLHKAKSLHLIEPYAPDAYRKRVTEAAKSNGVEAILHLGDLGSVSGAGAFSSPYNLLCLGMDLTSAAEGEAAIASNLARMAELIARAKTCVIEIPGHRMSLITWERLSEILDAKIIHDVTLDLGQDPVADSYYVKDKRSVRRMIVFTAKDGFNPASRAVAAQIQSAARDLAEAQAQQAAPPEISYSLGDRIAFTKDGASDKYARAGWVLPEARHRWMSGHESWLILAIDEAALPKGQGGGARLRGRMRALVSPGKLDTQSLIIRVNGQEVYSGKHKDTFDLDARIPLSTLRIENPVRISFHHPDASRPRDIFEGSKDSKVLSFAVEWMALAVE